jgi:hypothetical protein
MPSVTQASQVGRSTSDRAFAASLGGELGGEPCQGVAVEGMPVPGSAAVMVVVVVVAGRADASGW